MLKKRLPWLCTAVRARLWGDKIFCFISVFNILISWCPYCSGRYSSLLVPFGAVRVFWESPSGIVMRNTWSIKKNYESNRLIIKGMPCRSPFIFLIYTCNAKLFVKDMVSVVLAESLHLAMDQWMFISGSAHLRVPMKMFGTSWRCLPGKISEITRNVSNMSSSPAEMAGLRQYSDYIIGADSVLHESEVNNKSFF